MELNVTKLTAFVSIVCEYCDRCLKLVVFSHRREKVCVQLS